MRPKRSFHDQNAHDLDAHAEIGPARSPWSDPYGGAGRAPVACQPSRVQRTRPRRLSRKRTTTAVLPTVRQHAAGVRLSLVMDSAGNLYGTAFATGASGYGSVFQAASVSRDLDLHQAA